MFKFLVSLFIIYLVCRFVFNAFFRAHVHHHNQRTSAFRNEGNTGVNVSGTSDKKRGKDSREGEDVEFEEIR